MANLFLVRHGQASFGADDYDRLSPTGHEQSRLLGEYLAWFLWRRTFSEDRAATTARQVSATACDNTVRDGAHTGACDQTLR